MSKKEFYNTEEVMGLLKVSRITLYRWVKAGRLPAAKLGSTYRFLKDDIERYLLGQPIAIAKSVIAAPSRTPLDITARDIENWSSNGNKAAQALFPELIRRLIEESSSYTKLVEIHIPVGDQTGQSGWDGYIIAKEQNRYIPNGTSAWELGVGEPSDKAQSDYRKRTLKPLNVDPKDTTFVFVTPQNWAEGKQWINRKKQEKNYSWKDIQVLDATDLEAWIEQSPATKAWFMKHLQRPHNNIFDIEDYWSGWARATNPVMTPELLLVGRAKQKNELLKRIKNQSAELITVVANTAMEARAFVGATIADLPDNLYSEYASTFLVLESKTAWDEVVISAPNPLILIPAFTDMDEYSSALAKGHMVINAVDRSAAFPKDSSIVLNSARRSEIKDVLVKMGITEKEANKLALLGRSSMQSLWRKLAVAPSSQKPAWASHYKTLIPAMLVGQWSEASDGDKKTLSLIAGKEYDEFIKELHVIALEPDSPISNIDSLWYVNSKDDLWDVLENHMTNSELSAFINTAVDVLTEDDPKYDLPIKERWAASMHGKKREYSGSLQESIADTLAFIASQRTDTKLNGRNGQDIADSVAMRVFNAAKNDPTGRIWASTSDVIYLLAEASPTHFLAALESDLKNSPDKLRFLFQDSKKHDSMFSGSSPHTGFLNALEAPAWLSEYLLRSVDCLARLHDLDIDDGSYVNRPLASIKDIFLTWHPQTTASIDDRTQVLETIVERYPETSWELLVSLLPNSHEFTTGTYKPRWRQWANEDESVTYADMHAMVHEITKMIFKMAGDDVDRLTSLVKHIESLPPASREELAQRLEKIDVVSLSQESRLAIWEALKDVIYRHRKYSKQSWAMPAKQLDVFNKALEHLEPKASIDQAVSLFRHHVELPYDEEDWQKYDAHVAAARNEIIKDIYNGSGVESVLALGNKVDAPHFIGSCLALIKLSDVEQEKVLECITATDNRSVVARSYSISKFGPSNWQWVEQVIANSDAMRDKVKLGSFLSVLPTSEQTWEIVDKMDEAVQAIYWSQCSHYVADDTDYQRLAKELVKAGRSYNAIEALSHHIGHLKQTPANAIVFDSIESFLNSLAESHEQYDATMFRYHAKHLTDYLYEHIDQTEEERLAQLEWPLLLIMGHKANPRILQKELAANPEFFVDVLKRVYLPRGGERRKLTKREQQDARLGNELLDTWRIIPGDNGTHIDKDTLIAWLDKVLPLLKVENRLEVGLHVIGKLFARSRKDPHDEAWPEKPIRDAIEHIGDEELDEGMRMAVYNSRGVTTRSMGEGGNQERELAKKYTGYAEKMSAKYPHTKSLLYSIASMWTHEAERHDNDALKDEV